MSQTPPLSDSKPINGRDRTPELGSKREKRSRDEGEPEPEDRDRSSSGRRRHDERGSERRERERHSDRGDRGDRGDRDRDRDRDRERDRERRRHHEDETEEEREERRRRRREREKDRERERGGGREEVDGQNGNGNGNGRDEGRDRDRERERRHRDRDHRDRDRGGERETRDGGRGPERERDPREPRDRSRESHRSHRSRDVGHDRERPQRDGRGERDVPPPRSREEREAERERRDREMREERREEARLREERFAQIDREREAERRASRRRSPPPGPPPRDRDFSPRLRRPSPMYTSPPPPETKDPVHQLLDEVDSESRSIFVSQLASRMTSADLGLFFEDKLGRGSVRDARVVTDKVSRRSKGIGYCELDDVQYVNKALSLSGTIVMGIPIAIQITEAERNRAGQMEQAIALMQSGEWKREQPRERAPIHYQQNFPSLSTGLHIPHGLDVDAHKDAALPYHRLFVNNLAFSLDQDDIRAVFEPFGEIEFIDQHVDHNLQSKGTAYVQFRELRAAQMALDAMQGFELAGRPLRVTSVENRQSYVPEQQIEEPKNGPRMDNHSRQLLMQKLARSEQAASAAAPRPSPARAESQRPTPFVQVTNMFNPDEETERNWDLDLAEDVKDEIESKYGKVRKIKVDKMSRGDVYLEFDGTGAAERAVKGLNGRFFGGKQLGAAYITEGILKAHM